MLKLWWNLMYLLGRARWDTGVTPPEVRAVVESSRVPPGRALDLGCGTGTNLVYLAQHGFQAVGVDLAGRAVASARQKIRQAGLESRAQAWAGDVSRLDTLPVPGPYTLALDIGCLHSLDPAARARYASGLIVRLSPGALYLLYAFGPRRFRGRQIGIDAEEAAKLFAPRLALVDVVHGQDRAGAASAWYTFICNSPGGTS